MLKLEEVFLLKFQKFCCHIEIQFTLVVVCDGNTAMSGVLCHAKYSKDLIPASVLPKCKFKLCSVLTSSGPEICPLM